MKALNRLDVFSIGIFFLPNLIANLMLFAY